MQRRGGALRISSPAQDLPFKLLSGSAVLHHQDETLDATMFAIDDATRDEGTTKIPEDAIAITNEGPGYRVHVGITRNWALLADLNQLPYNFPHQVAGNSLDTGMNLVVAASYWTDGTTTLSKPRIDLVQRHVERFGSDDAPDSFRRDLAKATGTKDIKQGVRRAIVSAGWAFAETGRQHMESLVYLHTRRGNSLYFGQPMRLWTGEVVPWSPYSSPLRDIAAAWNIEAAVREIGGQAMPRAKNYSFGQWRNLASWNSVRSELQLASNRELIADVPDELWERIDGQRAICTDNRLRTITTTPILQEFPDYSRSQVAWLARLEPEARDPDLCGQQNKVRALRESLGVYEQAISERVRENYLSRRLAKALRAA